LGHHRTGNHGPSAVGSCQDRASHWLVSTNSCMVEPHRLVAVAIGLGFYAYCLVFHYRSYKAAIRVSFSPPHLVVAGPYRISRNPMYVSGLFTWLGWVVFYGSPAVLVALVLLWSGFTFRVIPHEERQLEALFGDDYREYKRSVRRWIGRY